MKVTITIEGKQGEGKTEIARELLALFEDIADDSKYGSDALKFNTYLADNGHVGRRTSSQFPHSVVITTITTDGESR